jgi:hypothetical protein
MMQMAKIAPGGPADQMKQAALWLLGLMLLPPALQADQPRVSACVEALEQLETLQTFSPVYKLTEGQKPQYLADADRPAELARIKAVVEESCSAKPDVRLREESDAKQLHLARSEGCVQDRDRLAIMEKPESRTPRDDLARHRKQVAAQCPQVDRSHGWLLQWVPPPIPGG